MNLALLENSLHDRPLKDGLVSSLSFIFPSSDPKLYHPIALFSLNEPDLNGISPGDAASWYQANINPIVSLHIA